MKAAGIKPIEPPPLKGKYPFDYPFTHDLGLANSMAKMGTALAGVEAQPIVWPDMKALDEKIRAERAPMPEATKERLREIALTKPRNVGDEIARMLEGKSLPQVYEEAAKYLSEDLKGLTAKYAHLNPGQQRMVCGNRMRAKWKALHLNAKTRGKTDDGAKPQDKAAPAAAAAQPARDAEHAAQRDRKKGNDRGPAKKDAKKADNRHPRPAKRRG